MDNLNENLNGMEKPAGCFRRFSKTIKVVVIAVLVLLLLIPMVMIEDMIRERGRTQVDAIEEVSQSCTDHNRSLYQFAISCGVGG